MDIIITSDTHLPSGQRKLPKRLLEACETADLIIHAGDWNSVEVYEKLSQFTQVKGVIGNTDDDSIRALFPEQERMKLAGFNIGIVHGHGEKQTTEKRVLAAFVDEHTDVIIYGHSHIPLIRYVHKTLLINPGSPTYKRKLPYYSFAKLKVTDSVQAELIFFET